MRLNNLNYPVLNVLSLFVCWPVDRLVSQCPSQTFQPKTHFTHSISYTFPAQSQHRLPFSTNNFPAIKRYSKPCTGLESSSGFQQFQAPRFQDNRHMKVVRLSALRTGRLYPTKYSWYSFLLETESNPGPLCGRKNYVIKNCSDTIGNRTRDFPACSEVP